MLPPVVGRHYFGVVQPSPRFGRPPQRELGRGAAGRCRRRRARSSASKAMMFRSRPDRRRRAHCCAMGLQVLAGGQQVLRRRDLPVRSTGRSAARCRRHWRSRGALVRSAGWAARTSRTAGRATFSLAASRYRFGRGFGGTSTTARRMSCPSFAQTSTISSAATPASRSASSPTLACMAATCSKR